MAEKTSTMLKEGGVANYVLKPYRGMAHSVSETELVDAAAFLGSVLPPDSTCDVERKKPEEMSVKELKAAILAGGLGSKAVGLSEKHELVKLLKESEMGTNKL